MIPKKSLISILAVALMGLCSAAQLNAQTVQSLSSPDGGIKVDVTCINEA